MPSPTLTSSTDALGDALPSVHGAAPHDASTQTAGVLAAALDPLTPPPGVSRGLAERLAGRAARSAAANRDLPVRRRSDFNWQQLTAQVRACPLQQTAGTGSLILEFAPGAVLTAAELPERARHAVYEWLVLDGRIELDVAAEGGGTTPLLLSTQDYHLAGSAAPVCRVSAPNGARVYLRGSAAGLAVFGDVCQSLTVAGAESSGWEPLRPGVDIKPLASVGPAVSMLARFRPGATVPGHPHSVDEECLMVEGELFLGDVLLREGDFQFAPGGSSHGSLFADTDCLLFFHGAVDPQSVDVAYRAQAGYR